jgi:type IV pilus assembly protein PilM
VFSRKDKTSGLVGLDIGSSSVKAVELKGKGGRYELANLALCPLSPDTIVDGAIMDALSVSSAIEKLFTDNKISTANVATSVSGHSVVVKRITVGATNEEELELAIQQEVVQQVRFDLSTINVNYYVLGPAKEREGLDVLLLAVKRDKIQSHTNVVSQAHKNAVVMDIDAFALQNAFELSYEPAPEQTVALLNIGASSMNVNITRGGMPLFTRDLSAGGNQYTDLLQNELEVTFEEAEQLKQGLEVARIQPEAELPHLRSVSEVLVVEVKKAFDTFHQITPDPIDIIYLAGGTARIRGLAELFQAELRAPVEILDPFRKIHCNPGKFDSSFLAALAPRMTVAVGLALRSFDAA